jgi:4-diphosphocytidyl-2-C-methyl-D-erythritol kinase
MTSRSLVIRSPAKINLSLRVGSRRDDGFHDVRTVLQSIAIFDTVTVTPRAGPLALDCRAPGVPGDRTNLVWRAAEHLWRALGRDGEPRDAHIKIEKGIPHAAGLGGGSADAAAALSALNTIWSGGLSRDGLIRLAGSLGSDVPFLLVGGTALGTGRGEELYPIDDVRPMGVVVIKPSFGVSTPDAYAWFDADRLAGLGESDDARTRTVDVDWPTGPMTLRNDLAAPVARRHPEISSLIESLYGAGALGAAMTGSGSAVFGLFGASAATRAAGRLKQPDHLVLVTRTLTRREAGRRTGR